MLVHVTANPIIDAHRVGPIGVRPARLPAAVGPRENVGEQSGLPRTTLEFVP
jgi:hypothetical protein